MKIVLQNQETLQFLTPDLQWNGDLAEAREFPDSTQATEFAQGRNLTSARVVLAFCDPPRQAPTPPGPRGRFW